jgi:chemotaxis protein methyltransferase WspC
LDLRHVEHLLGGRIGLNPESVGHDEVERAVRARMRALALDSSDAYLARLRTDDDELDELAEYVLIPVTWFFREPGAFKLLEDQAGAAVRAPGRGPFRVLSMASSTGEEPYSIAMTLLDTGLSAARARVDAVDVSRRSLTAARHGVYRRSSVAYVSAHRRHRYFEPNDGQLKVRDEVARLVRFHHANLLNPTLLADKAPYDVVFCRNVLIYLDMDARQRVLATISRLIRDDGVLITGHAEGQYVVAPRFQSAGIRGVLAYRKAAPAPEIMLKGPVPPPIDANEKRASGDGRKIVMSGTAPGMAQEHAAPVQLHDRADAGAGQADILDDIARLADAGNLTEAMARCLDVVAKQPDLAHAHFLLGVIELASRHPREAEQAFRRAIYLDPHHVDALTHLSLERARRGDSQEADQLRRRAGRAGGAGWAGRSGAGGKSQ